MEPNDMNELFDLSRDFLGALRQDYRRAFVEGSPFESRMSVILGQRGVGKTTVLVQMLLDYVKGDVGSRKVLYLPVDHVLVVNRSLYGIAKYFYDRGGEVICFDEIHKYSEWSRELKSIFDTFPNLKILASGSSALEVYRGSHDLSRRAISYKLHGLSFREYLELSYNIKLPAFNLEDILEESTLKCRWIVDELRTVNRKIIACFEDYLRYGYYPYYKQFTANLNLYYITLEQAVNAGIEGDLASIHTSLTGNSIKNIKKLLGHIAQLVPFKPELSKLRQLLEFQDDRTLKNYLKYLEDAHIIRALCRRGKSLNNMDKPEKIYINNPNMMYSFGKKAVDVGSLRETFFASALSSRYELYYPDVGDFAWEDNIFEVGGRNKGFDQLKGVEKGYIIIDGIEYGDRSRIPLWLMGFLY